MTYENFAKDMTSEGKQRKDVRKFAIRYALSLFISAFALAYIISAVLNTVMSVFFLLIVLFLYVWTFDLIADEPSYFDKMFKAVKVWWLYDIISVIGVFLINMFVL